MHLWGRAQQRQEVLPQDGAVGWGETLVQQEVQKNVRRVAKSTPTRWTMAKQDAQKNVHMMARQAMIEAAIKHNVRSTST